jgi:hypothetical protein
VLADRGQLSGHAWWWIGGLLLLGAVGTVWSVRRLGRRMPAVPVQLVRPTPANTVSAEVPADTADPGDGADGNDEPPHPLDMDDGYRRSLVEVMILALDCWQRSRHKGKVELAEESNLWRVYMDRSSLQTRTMDKYFLVETLPRNPRWRDVVRTAEYVLRHCPEPGRERTALEQALAQLKAHLRQAA